MTTANPYQTPDANLGMGGNDYVNLSVLTHRGRLGRIRYLAYSFVIGLAFSALVIALLAVAGGLSLLRGETAPDQLGMGFMIAVGLAVLLAIPATVIGIFMIIKRLHDIGWSGWLTLLIFVPLVNYVMILLLWCVPGTKGPNEHGAQTPPNGVGVTILGLINPVLTVLGIVAAFAMPMYLASMMAGGMPTPADLNTQAPAYEESAPAYEEAAPADDTSAPADTTTMESSAASGDEPSASDEAPADDQASGEDEAPAEPEPQQ